MRPDLTKRHADSKTQPKLSTKKIQAIDSWCESVWEFAGKNFGRITILSLALVGFVYVWFALHK